MNANGLVTYTPAAGFTGTDSFSYTVSDGNGGTATAMVSLTVTGISQNSITLVGGMLTIRSTEYRDLIHASRLDAVIRGDARLGITGWVAAVTLGVSPSGALSLPAAGASLAKRTAR